MEFSGIKITAGAMATLLFGIFLFVLYGHAREGDVAAIVTLAVLAVILLILLGVAIAVGTVLVAERIRSHQFQQTASGRVENQRLLLNQQRANVIIGLPVEVMADRKQARATLRALRRWMVARHHYDINGRLAAHTTEGTIRNRRQRIRRWLTAPPKALRLWRVWPSRTASPTGSRSGIRRAATRSGPWPYKTRTLIVANRRWRLPREFASQPQGNLGLDFFRAPGCLTTTPWASIIASATGVKFGGGVDGKEKAMSRLQELIIELHTLDQELARYEQKYGLLSETFFEWYQSGEEPDDPDWVQDFALWAGTYQLKLRRQEMYHRLVAETLDRQSTPTLIREALLAGA